MALSKIYIGSTLIMDGNDIANAIGSEVSNASTFTELVNAINTNKTSLAVNLTCKSITASAHETLSSLVSKVANIITNDISGIRSSIGSEISSNANVSDIVNAITSDKQILVNMLLDFGIPAAINETFSSIIGKLNGIVATRFRYATDSVADVTFLANIQNMLDTLTTVLVTPDIETPTDSVADSTYLTNMSGLSENATTLLMNILTLLQTANTTSVTIIPVAQSDLIAPMTSNTSADGTASCSSHFTGAPTYYEAYGVFNPNIVGGLDGWISAGVATGWLQFQFNTPKVVKQYNIVSYSGSAYLSRFPKNWTFQGSNDGSAWTTLDTQTNQSVTSGGQIIPYPITNTTAYTYYKLNITANNGDIYLSIGQLQLFNTVPVVPAPYTITGIASASSIYNSTYDVWKAFNQSLVDANDCWMSANNVLTGWLKYQFDTAKVVNRYELCPRNDASTGVNSFPKNFTFEGSNNGIDWTVLDTRINQSVPTYTSGVFLGYSIPNMDTYTYYRLNITANNGNSSYVSLGELRLLQV